MRTPLLSCTLVYMLCLSLLRMYSLTAALLIELSSGASIGVLSNSLQLASSVMYESIVNRSKESLKSKCLDLYLRLLEKMINCNYHTKFEVLTAVSMKTAVSWNVKPCSW
jgi:hypothetical protein